MKNPTLVIMAAGMGSRFGGLKQIASVDDAGHPIIDFSMYDAYRAGFRDVVFIIKKELEEDFREVVGNKAEQHFNVSYVYQELDRLPEGYSVPEGREKPWGTNHAVMMGKDVIKEPFAVLNCDDFYDRDAFQVMAKFLTSLPEGSKGKYAMVGFRVDNTLSESGTVSRGICEMDPETHLLTGVVERTKIERHNGVVEYLDEDGTTWVAIPDTAPTSMNFWGFTPDYFQYSEDFFKVFLSDPKNQTNLKSEFFIPLMVDTLIKEGKATCEVLDTTSKWFGVTYPEDRPETVAKLAALHEAGQYPDQMF